ncbi:hypothetical protein [Halomontanus rarus]|uniref:hypothetical protein n=1 Tax=Halomontanus rarus TaxID=3034020 RepID=UPI00307BCD19
MASDDPSKPSAPDLPAYLQEPLERQSPDRLESIADYATELAAWKRRKREYELEQKRAEEAVDDEELKDLEEREIATDPDQRRLYHDQGNEAGLPVLLLAMARRRELAQRIHCSGDSKARCRTKKVRAGTRR